jgi:hypothetical protein
LSKINTCLNFPTIELNKIALPENKLVEEYLSKNENKVSAKIELLDKLKYELFVKIKFLIKEKKKSSVKS